MSGLAGAISDIEARRDSRVVILAASHLDLDLLPMLHDMLHAMLRTDDTPRLDVLLYCKGGEVGAARRIALMLDAATDRLGIIAPDRCQSAGTIVALAGREIIAGPAAVFSPVDPALQASPGHDGGAPLISTEDIRRFGEMAKAWFGRQGEQGEAEAFATMTGTIFPPTLTAFYRATCEVEAICRELLGLRGDAVDGAAADTVVSQLMHGYHSHGFPLSGDDLAAMGLPVRRDGVVEAAAWAIAGLLRDSIGGGARETLDDDWRDACIATRDDCRVRRTGSAMPRPRWEAGAL